MEIIVKKDTPLKNFNHHWKFCVGADHAAYALRHDYITQLAEVRKELGIERVRFHGIFNDDMHTVRKATDILPIPFGGSYIERSFRQCAVVYDNILSIGMKPFVELSFMPKLMAQVPFAKGTFYYRPVVSMPMHRKRWHEYVKSFVRFLIERYGKEEIESWYFEVWNEPDLVGPFFLGTKKDYFQLYAVSATAVKEVDPQIKVGGPATSASRWIAEFLTFCKNNDVPVDFVSTHQYAGDPLGGIGNTNSTVSNLNIDIFAALKERHALSHDNIIDVYRSFMRTRNLIPTLNPDSFIKSSEFVSSASGDLPVFYTEWNLCASFSAECNDTSTQAAYLLHSILNSQKTVSGSSIWCFSDLFEEYHQFPEEFHGGFGLMTQSGIRKPSYHALRFLQEAGNKAYNIKANGKADCAVFRKKGETHVILSLLHLHSSNTSEEVSISIEADAAPSSVTVSVIDSKHCNPLHDWKMMGSPQVPTPAQLDELRKSSAVTNEPIDFVYEDGAIKINTKLTDNSIRRIIIRD